MGTEVAAGTKAAKAGVIIGDYLVTMANKYVVTDMALWAAAIRKEKGENYSESPVEHAIMEKVGKKREDTGAQGSGWSFIFHRNKYKRTFLSGKITGKMLADLCGDAGTIEEKHIAKVLGIELGDEEHDQQNTIINVLPSGGKSWGERLQLAAGDKITLLHKSLCKNMHG